MKRSIRFLILPAVLLGSAHALADGPQNYDAYYDNALAPAVTPGDKIPLAAPDGFASSMDTRRNIPKFLWASRNHASPPLVLAGTPEGVARWYVAEYAHRWGLPREIADNAELVHVHDTGRGGIIVILRQQIGGVEVHRNDIKVLLSRNLELIAISGSPRGTPAGELKHGKEFKLTGPQAIGFAMSDLYGLPPKAVSLINLDKTVATYHYFNLAVTPEVKAKDLHLVTPFRVKKVFYPMPDRLLPAYFLEIQAGTTHQKTPDAYAYVIAADSGRVLLRQNLTDYEVFNYRVWADPSDGRPQDGPIADFTPHPTGMPDGSYPAYIPPSLIAMEGFNHNPSNIADPWLPGGAVQTQGNNVDCYTDDDTPDGYSNGDIRATTTMANTFDRVYDVTKDPLVSQDQSMAALTQLFYDDNWLHDWWYDSGFNEGAGNAQQDNLGRGGLQDDVLHAEGQDGALVGSLNNANMSTPADGASPRMQMYLWSGTGSIAITELPNTPIAVNGTPQSGPNNYDVTADAAYVDDGVVGDDPMTMTTGTVNDGCEPFVTNVTGKIAVVDRGFCTFVMKATNALNAGAVGVLVVEHTDENPIGMSGNFPNIPILMTTIADGTKIKADLMNGPVQLHMNRQTGTRPDGTIDNGVVAHEWGHYLHHRLENCGLYQCRGMSEGWADFDSVMTVLRPGDDLDGTFAMAIYATVAGDDAGYYGIRRWPYTTDMNKNGLTFGHIVKGAALPAIPSPMNFASSDASEVHNQGEFWTESMFEGYVSLLKVSLGPNPRYTFQEARRVMTDYVVAGMQLTPVEPDYNEQRDAVLAASYANEPLDTQLLADAFAKRGLGTCAVSPPVTTADCTGLVESFTNQGNFEVLSLTIDDAVKSCDNDGVLDGDEIGNGTVTVMNTGLVKLANTKVTLSTNNAGVTFPQGASATIASLDPFATAAVPIQVALDKSVTAKLTMTLNATVENASVATVGSCAGTQTLTIKPLVSYDDVANSATIDTVESAILAWTATGIGSADVWKRENNNASNHVWHGHDANGLSDTSLESPSLDVSATDPFIITLKHYYSFEAAQNPATYYDGGVIEVSTDGGKKWVDISTYVDPGYGGTIDNTSQNPLQNRMAFVGRNPSYPSANTLTLDLGKALGGKTVKVRFRIGADVNGADLGWILDDLDFQGITNKPFPSVVDDTALCALVPVADAGPDQTVHVGDTVTLDGSKSSSPNNLKLSYDWTQTTGVIVPLSDPKGAMPTWVAPPVAGSLVFTFQLKASDSGGSASDEVKILVLPVEATSSSSSSSSGGEGGGGSSGPEGGCGCTTPGTDASGGATFATLLGLGMALIRRRRKTF